MLRTAAALALILACITCCSVHARTPLHHHFPPLPGSRFVQYHPTVDAVFGNGTAPDPSPPPVEQNGEGTDPIVVHTGARVVATAKAASASKSLSSSRSFTKTATASRSPPRSPSSSKTTSITPKGATASRSPSVSSSNSPPPTPTDSSNSAGTATATTAPSAQVNGLLKFYGGPVIQNVRIQPVFWNGNVKYQAELQAFYAAVAGPSAFWRVITQYHTTSPKQSIGFGSSAAAFTASQSTGSTAVQDVDLQTAMINWFRAGVLPSPSADGNSYYPIHFPPGVVVSSGGLSCSAWCGYHSTFAYNGACV